MDTEIKKCRDCKHCKKYTLFGIPLDADLDKCAHVQTLEAQSCQDFHKGKDECVTYHQRSCYRVRRDERLCGKHARLFVPKLVSFGAIFNR